MTDTSLHPLLKWPGGKSKEFDFIKDIIPKHSRYIEPFFGGGAVYFRLAPKKAIINDVADELVDFYRFLKNELPRNDFEKELLAYADTWDKIPDYIGVFEEKVSDVYKLFASEKIARLEFESRIEQIIEDEESHFRSLFSESFCIDEKNLVKQIKKNLTQKLIRTVKVEKGVVGGFLEGDLEKNIETGFRSGFYMHFRDLLNYSGEKYTLSRAKHIANWFFIRETCYGAMFRFNANGKFNIPYGGMGYNSKNLRKKIDYILSSEIEELFRGTDIYKKDFVDFFKCIDVNEDDFMFLDPPYDTDFSSYEGNVFDKNDQKRLAEAIYNIPAKWIMIIKKTDYISSLYTKSGITVESFEKNYLYNMRGRNDRAVEHLIIRNFD